MAIEHIFSITILFFYIFIAIPYWIHLYINFRKIKKFLYNYDLENAWKLWDKEELKKIKEYTEIIKNEK